MLLRLSKGNIKVVDPKYQKVFDVFVEENIFSYAPGTTSGAIGPGEMALSMMGNPAEKGKTGDLRIGEKKLKLRQVQKQVDVSTVRLLQKQLQVGKFGLKRLTK